MSFALNVCRNELKVDVMRWCGLGVDVEKTLHGVLGPSGSFERLQNPVGLLCRVSSRIAFIAPQHIEQQFWLTFFQICCIYFTHRCEKYVPYEQKKKEKKDDLECNLMTPLSMKFKGDESGFLLPGRFVKARHGLKGHPLANGTALGRSESNSIGLSSCQKPLGSRVKTSFPGSRA